MPVAQLSSWPSRLRGAIRGQVGDHLHRRIVVASPAASSNHTTTSFIIVLYQYSCHQHPISIVVVVVVLRMPSSELLTYMADTQTCTQNLMLLAMRRRASKHKRRAEEASR
jgi:hypothetical protein